MIGAGATAERYLLCRVGVYQLAIRTQAILRVWQRDAATAEPPYSAAPIDLRAMLDSPGTGAGFGVAFEMPERIDVLTVDSICGTANIAEVEFVALPLVFGFARALFDAACKNGFDGGHPLRLRSCPELSAN